MPHGVNTERTLELGIARTVELGAGHLVVPSLTGESAWRASEKLEQLGVREKPRLVCVTFLRRGRLGRDGGPTRCRQLAGSART